MLISNSRCPLIKENFQSISYTTVEREENNWVNTTQKQADPIANNIHNEASLSADRDIWGNHECNILNFNKATNYEAL